jgi:hypothetical protein
VVDGGDRVEDVAGVDVVPGGLIQLDCPQGVVQRHREVRRLVVDDRQHVQ